jgi:uncharacterized membrane protein
MSEAVAIYRRQWLLSVGYGLLFVLIGYGIAAGLIISGMAAALPVAVGVFALVGPLMAAGLYAIARADEAGRQARFREVLLPHAASPMQIAYLGVIILVASFLWVVAAIGLFAIFASRGASEWIGFMPYVLSTPSGIAMMAYGTLTGGFIAATIFALTAFSIPMLMDREIDFATAIMRSVETVLSQPKRMALWAWIILASVGMSVLTLFAGFVLFFPLLGFATWRAYRSNFPSLS